MSQQINIDPELWAKTRTVAFARGVTASRVVEDALRTAFEPPRVASIEQRSTSYSAAKLEIPVDAVDGAFPIGEDGEFDRHPRTAPMPVHTPASAAAVAAQIVNPVRAVPKPSQAKKKS